MIQQVEDIRANLANAKRVVVKVGTRVLVDGNGRPSLKRMSAIVKDLAWLKHQGIDPVLVSSGAIGAGMEAMGLKTRPRNLPDLQIAAAVGQTRLMTSYDKLFSADNCQIGQVLLTRDDLHHRVRHLNIRNTMMDMFRHNIIPIVNENDVVSVDEIKLGDNDILAALVAMLVQADLLVLLTSTNGLRAPDKNGRTKRINFLEAVNDDILALTHGKGGELSTGGMATKLEAAQTAASTGIPCVIADGRKPLTLRKITEGADIGTLLALPTGKQNDFTSRKKWIAFFLRANGSIIIDDGACKALIEQGKSLLPIGIKDIEGNFPCGAVVNIRNSTGKLIARGLAAYSSDQIHLIKGHRTAEIENLLGSNDYDEVIHRDNLVLMDNHIGS